MNEATPHWSKRLALFIGFCAASVLAFSALIYGLRAVIPR